MKPNIQGECNACSRSFDDVHVRCCCSHHDETGEEIGPNDRIAVPFVRHLDAFCTDCCGPHDRNLNSGVGDYTRMGDA